MFTKCYISVIASYIIKHIIHYRLLDNDISTQKHPQVLSCLVCWEGLYILKSLDYQGWAWLALELLEEIEHDPPDLASHVPPLQPMCDASKLGLDSSNSSFGGIFFLVGRIV